MIEEISNSVGSVFKERLVSPLFGTFLLSWSLWNWRTLYYLLVVDEKVDVQQRFSFIDQHFTNFDNLPNITNLLIGPVVLSVIWIWLYPIISSKVETYLARKRANKLKLIQDIDKTIPLTHEEAMAIYEKAEKQEERYMKLSKDNTERIAKLNQENVELLTNSENLKSDLKFYKGESISNKEKLENFEAEVSKAKNEIIFLQSNLQKYMYAQWASNITVMEAYTALKNDKVYDTAFKEIIAIPNVNYSEALTVSQDHEVLEGLLNKGILGSYKAISREDFKIELSSTGRQLVSLYKYRDALEHIQQEALNDKFSPRLASTYS